MLKTLAESKAEQINAPYDYNKYNMKLRDRLIAFLIGSAGAAVVMHIFFGAVIVDLIVGIAVGIIAQRIYRNFMINRIRRQLLLQFRDLLDSLNSSVSAGKVINSAFIDAEKDLALQYGEDGLICKEVRAINQGVLNSIKIEDMLEDFGKRSGIDDIVSFANVFMVSNRRGGNIKDVLGETKSILCDKIDIELEIGTTLSAAKNELNIIILMPLLIVPLMSSFTQTSGDPTLNIVMKIVGLAAFVAAYIIGRKITNIKL